jgi:hypothetical protein
VADALGYVRRAEVDQRRGAWADAESDYSRAIQLVERGANRMPSIFARRGALRILLGRTAEGADDYSLPLVQILAWPLPGRFVPPRLLYKGMFALTRHYLEIGDPRK